jgi:ribosomal protein S18 acetylase RimI-like enzyme
VDEAETDDLGLPLVRGLFPTLDGARDAIELARAGPAPTSALAERVALHAKTRPTEVSSAVGRARLRDAEPTPAPEPEPEPEPEPVVVRPYRPSDGDALRALWTAAGFRSLGDDDASLAAFAGRNPGLLLVAVEGETVVASALGAWDGRRGWIYHVATAASHRRRGIARDLIRQIEERLRDLGAPKVNVIIRDDNPDGAAFWEALGYASAPARQFGREL